MRRYILLAVLAVVVCAILLTPPLRSASRAVFLFPARLVSNVVRSIQDSLSFLSRARGLDEENRRLKEHLSKLKTENALYRAKLSDLERMMGYRRTTSRILPSKVIARDPTNWFNLAFIDRGSDDGARRDMPVLLSRGVVGRITETDPGFSAVLLAVDRSSKISAIVARTRELGIVEGTGRSMLIRFFSKEIEARPGNAVLTSGLGGIFPKGLNMGKITRVNTEGLVRVADVIPEVDFNKLEEVLILLKH